MNRGTNRDLICPWCGYDHDNGDFRSDVITSGDVLCNNCGHWIDVLIEYNPTYYFSKSENDKDFWKAIQEK
jgi:hypothetical protein